MRLFIILLITGLLYPTSILIGQSLGKDSNNTATYQFTSSVPIIECEFDGTVKPNTENTAPRGSKFIYIQEISSGNPIRTNVVFQFLLWNEENDSVKYKTFNIQTINGLDRLKTFCVDKNVFDITAIQTYKWGRRPIDFTAGVLILPIKMRFGGDDRNFDFSTDVTLGTVFGPRWRLHPTRETYLSMLIGAGISAVTLNPSNTGGIEEPVDRAAVTITSGAKIEVDRFQVGLMIGWDLISQPHQNEWDYQGKTWLSIGLGYSLLSSPPNTPAPKN